MFSFGSRRMTLVAALVAAGVAMMQPAMALPPRAQPLALDGGLRNKDTEVSATSTETAAAALEGERTPLYESMLPTTPAIALTVSENAAKDIFVEMKIDDMNSYTLFMGMGQLWTGEITDMLKADIVLSGHRIVNGVEQLPVEYLNMNMAEMIVAILKKNTEALETLESTHPVNLVMKVIETNMPTAENTKFWEAMSMVATEWITRVNLDDAAPAAEEPAAAAGEPAATDATAPAGDATVRHLVALTESMSAAFKAARQQGALRA